MLDKGFYGEKKLGEQRQSSAPCVEQMQRGSRLTGSRRSGAESPAESKSVVGSLLD